MLSKVLNPHSGSTAGVRHLGWVSWHLTSDIWRPDTVSQLYRLSESRKRDGFPQNPVYSICPWPQWHECKPCRDQPEQGNMSPWSCSLLSLCRTEAWSPILDEALRFQKTNLEHYKLLFNSRYFIHLRDVIHLCKQISLSTSCKQLLEGITDGSSTHQSTLLLWHASGTQPPLTQAIWQMLQL